MARINPNFKVHYTLTRYKNKDKRRWNGLTGRVNMDMLRKCGFPEPADDVFIAFSGPKEMNGAVRSFLSEHGYARGENYP